MLVEKELKPVTSEDYFQPFGENIIGCDHTFTTPYGVQKQYYADWIASGRLYHPIEDTMRNVIGPIVANTHSFSSETGKSSTYAYRHARDIIKKHVNANNDDVLVTSGSGMTSLLSRLQRIMGLRLSSKVTKTFETIDKKRPVVFISHMEHHSNQVPWMETIADVVIVPCDEKQLICTKNLQKELDKYHDRPLKIGAFTACSNVTGIITPYQNLAKTMHKNGGVCIIDFAASAPYVNIDMHPNDPEEQLDAVLFSPHKFLGGPGSCGVMVFNKSLYLSDVPDVPGGGNVKWTNPWGEYKYSKDIETREDGGTPGFLQAMRAAMAIRLKEKMGVSNIEERERQLLHTFFKRLDGISNVYILGDRNEKRIGCVSFGIEKVHYNLVVRLLNDRFGIQVRGGWSCASTYAHYLFELSKNTSTQITTGIDNSELNEKPGWVRISLHPTMTNTQLIFICDAIEKVAANATKWKKDYTYNPVSNEFEHLKITDHQLIEKVKGWFS